MLPVERLIEQHHLLAFFQQSLGKMRTDESSCPPCDQDIRTNTS